ncbi:MAG: cytochrome c4 [Gammaproteobacteria bacterium]|nr:cytochrome c4 [Gammaproteobacteria bacterium]MDE2264158.1 cytochrome c4 [Gammaproteobacteria bacterium]
MARRAPLATASATLLSVVGAAALATLAAPAVSRAGTADQPPAADSTSSNQAAAGPATATGSPAAASPPVTPDPYADGSAQAGAAKAAVCFSCHGPNGNSQNPVWPRLAGQNAVYIAEQLHLFKAGVRQNPVMQPMAAGLTDQDIDNVAVFFAAQTPAGLEADPSYWKAGQALYLNGDAERGVPGCVACHGPLGRGNSAAGYPALEAQQSVYVVSQLQNYANGTRYSGPNATTATANSVIMFDIAKRLTPEEIRDVASYVQGLR